LAIGFFEYHHLVPDLVYVDGAHEYAEVLADISAWWKLLRIGGILLGDDFAWPGVKKAAEEFAQSVNATLVTGRHSKWWLLKTHA